MRTSQKTDAIVNKLLCVQAEIKNPIKTELNPHFKSKYANLEQVLEIVLPLFSKHGILLTQGPSILEGQPTLITRFSNTIDQWIESEMLLLTPKGNMQDLCGAVTYSRRYSLCAMLGIEQEDDDGNSTHAKPTIEEKPKEPSKTPQEAIEKLKAQVTKSTYNPNNKTATNYVEHKHRWGEYKFDSSKEQCKNKLPDGTYCNLVRHKDTPDGSQPPFDNNDPLPF